MRHLPLVLCVVLSVGCEPPVVASPEGAGGIDAGTLPLTHVRLATFNVKLFFDTLCQSGSCAPGDFEQAVTQPAFDARATQLAQAIMSFEADMIALQEIEDQTCLDALLSRLTATLPSGALGEINTAGSVDVAILSRTPLEKVVGHRALERLVRPDGSRTNFSREFLEAHARTVEGTELVLFAAHFRSKVMDDAGRRLAEAQVSRRIVQDVAATLPNALVVMAGDLNDFPGSPPIDALTANGGLLRVAADLPVADQATYVFNGRGEAIDHILQAVTPGGQAVPRSAIVWKDSARGFGGSDHFAMTADFEMPRPTP